MLTYEEEDYIRRELELRKNIAQDIIGNDINQLIGLLESRYATRTFNVLWNYSKWLEEKKPDRKLR